MQFDIKYQPSYSMALVSLAEGEVLQAESGAMVSMSPNIQIVTQAKGGMFGALKRSVLGGESFFMNTFSAQNGAGQVSLAPSLPGDLKVRELSGETLFIQSGSYVASSPNVTLDTKWGGAKTFFSGEGLFMLKAEGQGPVLLSSYGAIHEIPLKEGETVVMDTGHMVAFDGTMQYNVRKIGNLKSTIFSGEGLVVDVTGPGTLYMQTRSSQALLSWLIPRMNKGGGRSGINVGG